eukprot:3725099-Rhodomonas_salina.1
MQQPRDIKPNFQKLQWPQRTINDIQPSYSLEDRVLIDDLEVRFVGHAHSAPHNTPFVMLQFFSQAASRRSSESDRDL